MGDRQNWRSSDWQQQNMWGQQHAAGSWGPLQHQPYHPHHAGQGFAQPWHQHPPAHSQYPAQPYQASWHLNQGSAQWAGAGGPNDWLGPPAASSPYPRPVGGSWHQNQYQQQYQQPWNPYHNPQHHHPQQHPDHQQHWSRSRRREDEDAGQDADRRESKPPRRHYEDRHEDTPQHNGSAHPQGHEEGSTHHHSNHHHHTHRRQHHGQGGLLEQYKFADPSSTVKYDELEPQLPGNDPGELGPEEVKAEVERRKQLPILLFDLNGTLTSHTHKRKSAGVNRMRPGVNLLPRLLKHFRLGIFTSASIRTVGTVKVLIEKEAGVPLFEPQLILSRNHTTPAPKHHVQAGGDPWDTVKPLSRWFTHLHRVLLFDDDAYKSVPGEESSMVRVPAWGAHEPPGCPVLKELVEALEQELGSCRPEDDVRTHVPAISARLAKVALPPPTPASGAGTPSAAGGDTSEGDGLGKESDGDRGLSEQQEDDRAEAEEEKEKADEEKGKQSKKRGKAKSTAKQLVAAVKDANELDLGDLEEDVG